MRRTPESPTWSGPVAVLGLAVAATLAAITLVELRPPAPLTAAAPATAFSAARAMGHVEQLAATPRTPGTPEHAAARDDLVERLESLGLETRVQRATLAGERGDRLWAARVENVVARRRGTAGGEGAILLLAHYDSRPHTPGAGDDASGVAILLELLRALGEGPPIANDIVILLSDAEEIGLLGARGFAENDPWADDVRVVLNFEARGRHGLASMFETGAANGRLIELLAATPYPTANSLSGDAYRRMPNDTDFSIFRDAGRPGLNFAFIGGLEAYHTALDTAAALSPASLQHAGGNGLALVRRLGDADLDDLTAPDAVYFNPWGFHFVHYPASLAVPLAVGATLALLLTIGAGARRERFVLKRAAGGVGAFLGTLVVTCAFTWLAWSLFEQFFPAVSELPFGVPYERDLLAWGFVLLALAVAAWIFGVTGDERTLEETAAGVLLGWAALAVASAVLLPGGSYIFVWPLVAGTVGLALSRAVRGVWPLVLLTLAALPGVVLLTPVARLMFDAFTVASPVAILPTALLLTLLGAPLAAAAHRRPFGLGLGLLTVALAVIASVGVGLGPDAERPRFDSLFYALDAETGEARWLSFDAAPDGWTTGALGTEPEAGPMPEPLVRHLTTNALWAPAPALPLAAPQVRLVGDESGERRRLTVHVSPGRDASAVVLHAVAPVPISAVVVDGVRRERAYPSRPLRLTYYAPPREGFELAFEMSDRQPIEMSVISRSRGLPDLPGVDLGPRPPGLMPDVGWWTDSTSVRKIHWY